MPILSTIKKSNIFKELYNSKITVVSSGFVLKFLPNSKKEKLLFTDNIQFGFIVSKKLGTAVKRNFIKRRLKNAIREQLVNFTATGFYVFIARSKLSAMKYAAISSNIRSSLESLNYLLNK